MIPPKRTEKRKKVLCGFFNVFFNIAFILSLPVSPHSISTPVNNQYELMFRMISTKAYTIKMPLSHDIVVCENHLIDPAAPMIPPIYCSPPRIPASAALNPRDMKKSMKYVSIPRRDTVKKYDS